MGTFSALYWPFVRRNSPVTGDFPHKGQWRGALMFSLICLSKQSRRWWFQTPSRSLWRHCNGNLSLHGTHDELIAWLLRQNDDVASFWCNNDVHVTSCDHWAVSATHPVLTHWGRVTHICVGKITILGSDNGLSPGWRQAIIWTNPGILLIGPLGTNFGEISIGIQTFSFDKVHLQMSFAKMASIYLCCRDRCNQYQNFQEHLLGGLKEKSTPVDSLDITRLNRRRWCPEHNYDDATCTSWRFVQRLVQSITKTKSSKDRISTL